MGAETKIAWTDATFNGWMGCEKVSAECKHCYAEAFTKRIGHGVRLPMIWGGASSSRRFLSDDTWRVPLRLNAQATREATRRKIFAMSLADVFEPREDLLMARERFFRLVEATPMLDWQILTKRPEHVPELAERAGWARTGAGWPLNVWLGTTCGLNETMKRVEDLLAVRGPRYRFVSYEPALEVVRFNRFMRPPVQEMTPIMSRPKAVFDLIDQPPREAIDWLIVGGESGPKHRTMDIACVESAVSDAVFSGTAVFVKQDSGPQPGAQGRIPDALWAYKQFPHQSR